MDDKMREQMEAAWHRYMALDESDESYYAGKPSSHFVAGFEAALNLPQPVDYDAGD